MRVTLVRPPAYSAGLMGAQLVPFLGIAYVAAALRRAGHDVSVIDMCGEEIDRTEVVRGRYVRYGMSLEAALARLGTPDVIGVTSSFSMDWVFHRELILALRAAAPRAFLIAGGEHVSALPEFSLRDCPALDAVVVGEGEETAVRLLAARAAGADPGEVRGVAWRDAGGTIRVNPRADRIRDIDRIPPPAWDLFPLANYLDRGLNYHVGRGRTVPMLATRGCPYSCSFCSNDGMWGHPWVSRSPGAVVEEMRSHVEIHRAENFVFSDLTAVVRRDHIVALCREILDRGLAVTWQLPTLRTEAVDREVLSLMRRAGCRELDFAIESGSEVVLRSVNKRSDPGRIAALVREALAEKMNLSVNIVLGLPAEGLREYAKSYLLCLRLAVLGLHELNAFPFIPYPGSPLFREFLAEKRIVLDDAYFLSLFGYADLAESVSWSKRFSPRAMNFLRIFLMTSFYAVMFASHPARFARFLANLARGRATTKLEGVLRRVRRNREAYAARA